MKPHTLSIDIETFSSVDITKCGVYRYVESEDFEILLFAYSMDYGPVQLVDLISGDVMPEDILSYIWDPDVEKTAYNANFERTCIGRFYNRYCPPEQWSCTMVLAASCGLPLGLKNVGEALELSEDKAKMKEGADLIRYFCVPCRPTKTNGQRTRNYPEHAPDKWEVFRRYNIRDVETENTIRKRLLKWRPDYIEQRFWALDQRMNDAGIRIEPKLAENAIKIGNDYREKLLEQAKQISGLENPNSTEQIKSWLEEQEDIKVVSLNKKEIANVVASLSSDAAKEVMKLREEFSKSSTKKYEAYLRCRCKDDHIRGLFQFYGASTGRFSGRLVQVQNLPHDTLPDLDDARDMVLIGDAEDFETLYPKVQASLSALLRTVLIPEENSRFIVADFSAIEARVIAWIAGEKWRIEAFKNGEDIYCASASRAFKIPVVKHGINGEKRQYGKIIELACIGKGEKVLTDYGLVPIEKVKMYMKVWDGQNWVQHDGVVHRGLKPCIRYQGLTATVDHPVCVRSLDRHGDTTAWVPFGYAAVEGRWIVDGMYPASCDTENPISKDYIDVYDIVNAGPNHCYTVSGKLVHNCGFGGSIGAMKAFGADKMGMTEEEMISLVDKWREASPRIVALWKSLEAAAIKCVNTGKTQVSSVGKIKFEFEDSVLWMRLPSGRRIAYPQAEVTDGKFGKPSISYMSMNQTTKKWERTDTFSGKLTENLVQATARDCLREALFHLSDAGYDVRATIHDEVIITAPNDFGSLDEVIQLMCKGAPWMEGLPLNAAGFEASYYQKD